MQPHRDRLREVGLADDDRDLIAQALAAAEDHELGRGAPSSGTGARPTMRSDVHLRARKARTRSPRPPAIAASGRPSGATMAPGSTWRGARVERRFRRRTGRRHRRVDAGVLLASKAATRSRSTFGKAISPGAAALDPEPPQPLRRQDQGGFPRRQRFQSARGNLVEIFGGQNQQPRRALAHDDRPPGAQFGDGALGRDRAGRRQRRKKTLKFRHFATRFGVSQPWRAFFIHSRSGRQEPALSETQARLAFPAGAAYTRVKF